MTESEIFKYIIKNDTETGPGRLESNKVKSSLIIRKLKRGWWIKTPEDSIPISNQIIYDIFKLGLTSIDQRPKCPYCGDLIKFYDLRRGYKKSCDKKECFKRYMKDVVWGDPEYRKRQTEVHKEWAKKPENQEYLVRRTLNTWKNEEYRKKQVKVHIDWAKNNPDKVGAFMFRYTNKGIVHLNKLEGGSGEVKTDSSWEVKFLEFCDNLDDVVSISRANFGIPYYYNNETRNYFPDFVIKTVKETLLVEVKPYKLSKDEKSTLKLESGRNYVKSSDEFDRFVLITEKELFTNSCFRDLNTEELIKALLGDKNNSNVNDNFNDYPCDGE